MSRANPGHHAAPRSVRTGPPCSGIRAEPERHAGWSRRRASDRAAGEASQGRRALVFHRSAPNEETMNKDVDPQALSAAIAGFLACHVLTCRFLVQEGIVDRDRFIA